MKALRKITYNCNKATFLIEKKQITGISLIEQFELRYHLTGCSVCRLFEQQSLLINRVFRGHSFVNETQKLTDDFKEKLAKRIEVELDSKL